MDHAGYTRSEWGRLRELAALAWERELGAELARLEEAFGAWRAGALSPHALSDQIHRFHQGPSRALYGIYTRLHPTHLVARAIVAGLLAAPEVPGELVAKLSPAITYYQTDWPPGIDEDDPPRT